jgi:hypothetical protein
VDYNLFANTLRRSEKIKDKSEEGGVRSEIILVVYKIIK